MTAPEGATTGGSTPYVPPNPNHGLGADKVHRPAIPVAPPTSHELHTAQRQLTARLDVMRADLEAHQAEAHPRPLPNFVGSVQAQWQIVPAPIKQMVYIYGAMVLVAVTVRLIRWLLLSFRTRQEEQHPPQAIGIIRQWPPQQ